MLNYESFKLDELWNMILVDPLIFLPWVQMAVISLAMPLAMAVLLLAIGRLMMGSWRWAMLLAVAGTTLLFGMAGYWPSRVPPLADSGTTFRVAHLNTLVHNESYASKIDFIKTSNADIISFVETSPELAKQIQVLNTTHPYKELAGAGTMLLSKWPLKKLQSFSGKAALYSVKPPDGKLFYVLQMHPTSPATPERLIMRNAIWQQMTEATLPQPLLVLGDANTVPWDAMLTTFTEKNTLKTHGWLPSFPSLIPVVPIDLLLAPPAWQIALRRVYVPETDHLGWVADITH